MAIATLLPVPKARFFDSNGEPLANGKLYTYEAGTQTPKATYTDASGNTENDNPVELDASGEADIWINGTYYMELYDEDDNLQWAVDDISNNSTTSTYVAGTVGGTANALTVATTSPDGFTLGGSFGKVIYFVPVAPNTGSATLNVNGTGVKNLTKISPNGLVPLTELDLVDGVPAMAYYDGTQYVVMSIPFSGYPDPQGSNFSLSATDFGLSFVCTAALTISLPLTTDLSHTFYVDILALGGAVTLNPNVVDSIQGQAADANYVIPAGTSARLYTDGAFNWYLNFLNINTNDGGYINKFRNGTFDIAQRGTSGTVTTGNTQYTVDGWYVSATGATVSWVQTYGSVGSSPVTYANFLQLTGNASMSNTFMKQRIESYVAAPLAGRQVTVQFVVNNITGASLTPTLTVKHANAQDNWGATTTDVNAVNMQAISSGGSSVIAYTFAASASSVNGLEITLDFGAALNTNGKQVLITNADIRVTNGVATGQNNSPPAAERRPIGEELAFCQRYLPGFGTLTGPIGTGAATSTSASGYFIPFQTATRINPTGLTIVTPGDLEIATFAGVDVAALTGLTFSSSSVAGAFVTAAVSGTPLTSGTAYYLYAKIALAGNLIFTGAEL